MATAPQPPNPGLVQIKPTVMEPNSQRQLFGKKTFAEILSTEFLSQSIHYATIDDRPKIGLLKGAELPQNCTATLLCLILKIQNLASFADFRPISLTIFFNEVKFPEQNINFLTWFHLLDRGSSIK